MTEEKKNQKTDRQRVIEAIRKCDAETLDKVKTFIAGVEAGRPKKQ